MGTTLEDLMNGFEELKEHIEYYFVCTGNQTKALSFTQSLNELKERLVENAKNRSS